MAACACSELDTRRPARKAPRARERPTAWVRAAVPSPMARATRRSISSFRIRATSDMTRGTTLAARKAKGTRMSAALPKAIPRATSRSRPSSPKTGMRMVRTTTARSSTRVRPIITRPCGDWSSPRSARSRARTMVLATETTMPTITPDSGGQPRSMPTSMPRPIDMRMPSGAPSRATHLTSRSAFGENSMPTEYMRRMTPTSAMISKVWMSETAGPGVKGLMRMPPRT